MGICGLLQNLKFCTRKGSVREFSGKCIVVDASSWLHKSVYSIAEHYVEAYERGNIDPRCVNTSAKYIFTRCEELLNYAGISNIFLVMDGKRCPLKAVTNQDRESRRRANLMEARAFKKQHKRSLAEEKYKACIKIVDSLTKAVMANVESKCRKKNMNIHFVWAPYEADAQMVRICVDGQADAIVTEDSDVLVYLAACHAPYPVLYKLDRGSGQCSITSMEFLLNPSDTQSFARAKQNSKNNSLAGFQSTLNGMRFAQKKEPGHGVRQFVQACCLSGCDYAPNMLHGIGLVTAFKLVRGNCNEAPEKVFRKVLSSLPDKATKNIDRTQYEENLAKSEAVFYYHPCLDKAGNITTLVSPKVDGESTSRLNKWYPDLGLFEDISFLGNDHFLKDLHAGISKTTTARPALLPISNTISASNTSNKTPTHACGNRKVAALPPMRKRVSRIPPTNPYLKKARVPRQHDNFREKEAAKDDENACDEILTAYRNERTERPSSVPVPTNGFGLQQFAFKGDVRHVKRHFGPEPPATRPARGNHPVRPSRPLHAPTLSAPTLVEPKPAKRVAAEFQYDVDTQELDPSETLSYSELSTVALPSDTRTTNNDRRRRESKAEQPTFDTFQTNESDSESSSLADPHEQVSTYFPRQPRQRGSPTRERRITHLSESADEVEVRSRSIDAKHRRAENRQSFPIDENKQSFPDDESPHGERLVQNGLAQYSPRQSMVRRCRIRENIHQEENYSSFEGPPQDELSSVPSPENQGSHGNIHKTSYPTYPDADYSSQEDLHEEDLMKAHASGNCHTLQRRDDRHCSNARVQQTAANSDYSSGEDLSEEEFLRQDAFPDQRGVLPDRQSERFESVRGKNGHKEASYDDLSSSRHSSRGRGAPSFSNQPLQMRQQLSWKQKARRSSYDDVVVLDNPDLETSKYFANKTRSRRVTLEGEGNRHDDSLDDDSVVDLSEIVDEEECLPAFDEEECLPAFDYGPAVRAVHTNSDNPSSSSHDEHNRVYSHQPKVRTNFKPKPFRNPKRNSGPSPLEKAFQHQNDRYGSTRSGSSQPLFSLGQINSITRSNRNGAGKSKKGNASQQRSLLGFAGFGLTVKILEREQDDF
ncbi:Exonuclease 1 [Seminavis robusta]|uniref:Exonuclease 1 n=1 Tax=Seminavis robusta TaxID=568900 RepID=A0A9N8DDL8_9STRA|nr:Exonuclease 1 [Seminavis robusta]|eukprot:Sro70_g039040.1 Exonuclease 1 (1103) ;mRNA; r:93430-96895